MQWFSGTVALYGPAKSHMRWITYSITLPELSGAILIEPFQKPGLLTVQVGSSVAT